jgi:hypothetical protein
MSLTDTLGSLAIASKGHFMTGVSTDIGTSFIRPAGIVGDTLYGNAVVTAIGKSLAYTRVDFTNDKGTLVAYGSMFTLPMKRESTDRTLFHPTRPHKIYRQVIKSQGSSRSLNCPSLAPQLAHLRKMWSLLKTGRSSSGNLLRFVQLPPATALRSVLPRSVILLGN